MKSIFTFFACIFLLIGCKSETQQNEGTALEENEPPLQEQNQDSDNIEINPISHATAVINWDDTIIYNDPTGGAEAFERMEDADLVLISDIHGDHMDPETLSGLNLQNTPVIVPQAVRDQLPDTLQLNYIVMDNGETINEAGFSIDAIPMYNLREEATQFHPKGRGNGYVLEKDGKRLYIAGDTEGIPEMRDLVDIDIALIPMNLPYTMPVEDAADAVVYFAPDKVYPYHYRGTDGMANVERFKLLVTERNENIDVILADWYPNNEMNE